jgi:hypothetical protein
LTIIARSAKSCNVIFIGPNPVADTVGLITAIIAVFLMKMNLCVSCEGAGKGAAVSLKMNKWPFCV